jgi:hypothetical protein
VLEIGTFVFSDATSTRVLVKQVLQNWAPDATLLELPVIIRGKLGDELKLVCDAITGIALPRVSYVTPAQWKGTPEGRSEVPVDSKLTVHERDAYRMGRWWLQSRRSSC